MRFSAISITHYYQVVFTVLTFLSTSISLAMHPTPTDASSGRRKREIEPFEIQKKRRIGLECTHEAKIGITDIMYAATEGDISSQVILAEMYRTGTNGVAKDFSQALRWYSIAARQGSKVANIYLGKILCNETEIEKDHAEMLTWLIEAAENGDAKVNDLLGYLYCKGRGVPKDLLEARKYLSRAARSGHPRALYHLGELYRMKTSFKNYELALKNYRQAAESDIPEAQRRLASLLKEGLGCTPDPACAIRWQKRSLPAVTENKLSQGDARALEKMVKWIGFSLDQEDCVY